MKISVDTNVLLRLVVPGDPNQQRLALEMLKSAELVAISLHTFCELVWVMQRAYKSSRSDITAAVRMFMNTRNVVVDRPAVEKGLGLLERGGDFADGAIAFDGIKLGGETFVSFDRTAVKLLTGQGIAALLLE